MFHKLVTATQQFLRRTGGELFGNIDMNDNDLTEVGDLTMAAAGLLQWTGRAILRSAADGLLRLSDQAGTAGAMLLGGDAAATGVRVKYGAGPLAAIRAGDDSGDAALTAGTVTSSGDVIAGAGSSHGFTGRSQIQSSADGLVTLLNNAKDGFTRLCFGGTDSTFPAIKRSTTELQVRLAGDSAYTSISAQHFKAFGNLELNSASNVIKQYGGSAWDAQLQRGSAAGLWKITNPAGGGAGVEMPERTDPAAVADTGILFVRNNGFNKSELCVRFGTGAIQIIATEP